MTRIAESVRSGHAVPLPSARGTISQWVINALESGDPASASAPDMTGVDAWSDDAQLALFICQEMHYRGWRGIDPALEWDPSIIAARVALENVLLAAVDRELEPHSTAVSAADALEGLARDSLRAGGAVERLRGAADGTRFRDYFAARSLYHLKEADPHAWVIPRLAPASKAPFVAVEFDEYGAGRGEDVHQCLYADLLEAMGMDHGYLDYLDRAPAAAIAPVTLMSAFGLRRAEMGAAIGHFAATEVTSPPGSARMVAALERIGAPEPAIRFYREHVEADAVHELVMRHDVVGAMIAADPCSERDIVRGIAAWRLAEDRLDDALLTAWRDGKTLVRDL
ncbi:MULTISPECIES: iron-containing redox enzyme family protein [Tsukamurella]|uniref:Iron-containing redox enzyme family protein n=2 Tax=Tsukamurella TaxID=2060 RepID=A0A5C5RZI6_9ACTN|nr:MULTISPECIES: iron-containing redox enzyme family protein [Tsukamurella]NMD54629.1 iron-containing redox enzyme family protein [Tsukamurella columbiensis]TWS28547.1 iron-containing redox enzyme family protein [Tsukamurella conjunctivitidis]